MAFDAFLVIKGPDVEGESKDSVYAGNIDIISWNWGMSQTGSFAMGGGGGVGKASFQDISITKYVDNSTPTLMQYITNGKHFESGKIVCRKAGGEKIEYMVIELSKILVSSLSVGGSNGDEQLIETISLNFAEFKVIYTNQNNDGTKGISLVFFKLII